MNEFPYTSCLFEGLPCRSINTLSRRERLFLSVVAVGMFLDGHGRLGGLCRLILNRLWVASLCLRCFLRSRGIATALPLGKRSYKRSKNSGLCLGSGAGSQASQANFSGRADCFFFYFFTGSIHSCCVRIFTIDEHESLKLLND